MPFLLDTCALSELVARIRNPHVVEAIMGMPRDELFISVISVGEIHGGIDAMAASARKTFLTSWFSEHVLGRYGPRTLLLDVPIALLWGELKMELRQRGAAMQADDSLIAATALAHGLTLVTRNEKHFVHTGVQIFNPWR